MSLTKVKRQLKLSQWLSIIQACQSSGQTVTSWCAEHDVKPHAYYYWLKIIREQSLESLSHENSLIKLPDSFLPVQKDAHIPPGLICVRHYQTTIELPSDYDVRKLAILVKELTYDRLQ